MGLPLRLDDFAGGVFRDKPVYTLDQIADQLDYGTAIPGRTITYSFLDTPTATGLYNRPLYQESGFTMGAGYSPMSEAERAAARLAIQAWDDLIPQRFVEKEGAGVDIELANTSTNFPGSAGLGWFPQFEGAPVGPRFQSDVWITSTGWTHDWLSYGSYGFQVLVHELGHTLGLLHPSHYGAGQGANYVDSAIFAQDSQMFSVMSYFNGNETGNLVLDPRTSFFVSPQTPMVHDVVAIQAKYGADLATRVGDTVYGFNTSNPGSMFDFGGNRTPYLTIYDAGGNDTLDLSGANGSVLIDLRPGSFSSFMARPTLAEANAEILALNALTDAGFGDLPLWGSQADYDGFLDFLSGIVEGGVFALTGVAGVRPLAFQNIAIAYGTTIENAIGGGSRDYLVGNDAANRLLGAGGDDVLNGLGGDDTLSGGAGADEFRFTALGGADRITDYVLDADYLNLSEIDADAAAPGNQAFVIVGAFTQSPGQAVLSYSLSGDITRLALDVNGDGVSDLDVLINGPVANTANWLL
jgi:serralysin